ncbi:hypothetical protein ACNKHL_12880 [Shigella flexneri]
MASMDAKKGIVMFEKSRFRCSVLSRT